MAESRGRAFGGVWGRASTAKPSSRRKLKDNEKLKEKSDSESSKKSYSRIKYKNPEITGVEELRFAVDIAERAKRISADGT